MTKIEKGKPLVLRNGSKVLPTSDDVGSKVITADEIEEHEEQQKVQAEIQELIERPLTNEFTDSVKRTLADVPVDFNHMNVVMLVVSYTMWGLDEFAISNLMRVNSSTVSQIKQTDLYTKIRDELVEALHFAEEASVHGYIQAKALAAAQVMVKSLTSKKEDVRINAAKDILDRSGYRPVDRVEHTHRFEDELRIRYVSDPHIPTIELEANIVDVEN